MSSQVVDFRLVLCISYSDFQSDESDRYSSASSKYHIINILHLRALIYIAFPTDAFQRYHTYTA